MDWSMLYRTGPMRQAWERVSSVLKRRLVRDYAARLDRSATASASARRLSPFSIRKAAQENYEAGLSGLGVVGGADVPDRDACAARASDSRQLGRTAAYTGICDIAGSPSGRWCHRDTQVANFPRDRVMDAHRHGHSRAPCARLQSTARALGVCVMGWALSLAVAAAIGILFATPVS